MSSTKDAITGALLRKNNHLGKNAETDWDDIERQKANGGIKTWTYKTRQANLDKGVPAWRAGRDYTIPYDEEKQVTKAPSKGRRMDGKENDQYETANVPGNSYGGIPEGDPSYDPEYLEDYPELYRRSQYEIERDLAGDATDRWEVEHAKRDGEYGPLVKQIAKQNDLKAAKAIYRDLDGMDVRDKKTQAAMGPKRRLLLQRMIEQKVADDNGTLPKWVRTLDNTYDLGYPSEMAVGTGLRNGKRSK